ncbi:MAG: ATP-binding cassette domain-containing protein [Alphaproteobacteria bacterium]
MTRGLEARLLGQVGTLTLDVTLSLPPAGVTALTGPSGSGKSTLIRALAGLTRLKGQVRIGDETWQDEGLFKPSHQRAIGVVFQDAGLLSHLTVRGNLDFGLRRAPQPHVIRFDDVVDLMGLSHLIDRKTAHLSGGERQRVAMARALLTQPRLLLMDEPLASLDPDSKASILPYLQALHQTLALPVLYVAHDREEIAAIADRIAVMTAGAVIGVEDIIIAPSLEGRSRAEIEALAQAALDAGLLPRVRS